MKRSIERKKMFQTNLEDQDEKRFDGLIDYKAAGKRRQYIVAT